MARLRSPVAVSRSGTASSRWMSSTLTALGRRLTFLGGVTGAAGSVGTDERGDPEGVCSADCRHGAGDGVRPQGQGQVRCPSAVGVSFSGAPAFSGCPARPFPARPFPVLAPIRRRSSVPAILRLLPALPEIPARSGCFSPRVKSGKGTVGAASSRMKERTCAVVMRSGSMIPRVAM